MQINFEIFCEFVDERGLSYLPRSAQDKWLAVTFSRPSPQLGYNVSAEHISRVIFGANIMICNKTMAKTSEICNKTKAKVDY